MKPPKLTPKNAPSGTVSYTHLDVYKRQRHDDIVGKEADHVHGIYAGGVAFSRIFISLMQKPAAGGQIEGCLLYTSFTNLAFDGFFALVITGIAGVDHSGHGKHLSLHVIERWSVLSKHCFV